MVGIKKKIRNAQRYLVYALLKVLLKMSLKTTNNNPTLRVIPSSEKGSKMVSDREAG